MDGSPDPPYSIYTSPHLMTYHPTASPNYLIIKSHCVEFPFFAFHFFPFALIRTNTFLEYAVATGPGLPHFDNTICRSVSVIVYSSNCVEPFLLVGFYFILIALIRSYTFLKQAVATKPGLPHFVNTYMPVCVCDSLCEEKNVVPVLEFDIDQEDKGVVYHFVIIALIRQYTFLEHTVATGPGLSHFVNTVCRSVFVIVCSRMRVMLFLLVESYVLVILFRSYTLLKHALATKPGLPHFVNTLCRSVSVIVCSKKCVSLQCSSI